MGSVASAPRRPRSASRSPPASIRGSSATPPARCSSCWRSCRRCIEADHPGAARRCWAAALVFTGCFIIVNGMQAMVSRLMDGRRTLVVSVRAAAGLHPLPVPRLLCRRADWLQPVVSSPMAIGMLTALALNAAFRIGIKKSWSMEFTPGADSLDRARAVRRRAGRHLGRAPRRHPARRPRHDRDRRGAGAADRARHKARVTMSFDEYWLEVTADYRGKPLVIGGDAPSHEELLDDDIQLTAARRRHDPPAGDAAADQRRRRPPAHPPRLRALSAGDLLTLAVANDLAALPGVAAGARGLRRRPRACRAAWSAASPWRSRRC